MTTHPAAQLLAQYGYETADLDEWSTADIAEAVRDIARDNPEARPHAAELAHAGALSTPGYWTPPGYTHEQDEEY